MQVAALHLRMSRLIRAALRGEATDPTLPLDAELGNARERQIAAALILVWFSALVGWSADLHPAELIQEHVRNTARLILNGAGDDATQSRRSP
jgi:hypothetical protein